MYNKMLLTLIPVPIGRGKKPRSPDIKKKVRRGV
jgi:hypothetical protein